MLVLIACLMLGVASPAWAASLSVSYNSSGQSLPAGTIVTDGIGKDGVVVPAASGLSQGNIVGVVVPQSDVVVSQGIGMSGADNAQDGSQVQVSTSGLANVLVSDINGPIVQGSKIAASPLAGIGMLATESGKVVGAVRADLTDKSPNAKHITVTDNDGKQRTVLVALLPVMLDVGFYQPPPNQNSLLPNFLKSLANAVGGRDVPAGRLVASFVIMIVALVMVVILLSSGVRSSIGAIGRNPLAKRAIQGSLVAVLLLAGLVLVVSSSVSYLILRG